MTDAINADPVGRYSNMIASSFEVRPMSSQRFISALIAGLCCVTIASSSSLHPAFAETPAQYLTPVQLRIVKFFDNGNIYAVQNQPTRRTTFTLSRPTHVTKIMTYHWNDGLRRAGRHDRATQEHWRNVRPLGGDRRARTGRRTERILDRRTGHRTFRRHLHDHRLRSVDLGTERRERRRRHGQRGRISRLVQRTNVAYCAPVSRRGLVDLNLPGLAPVTSAAFPLG